MVRYSIRTQVSSITVLTLLSWHLGGRPALSAEANEITHVNTTLYGGAGDQAFKTVALDLDEGRVYAAGMDVQSGGGTALAVAYAATIDSEPSLAWDLHWPTLAGPPEVDVFHGVTAASGAVYLAGRSYHGTVDHVGSKEGKSVLVRLPEAGPIGPGEGGIDWAATPIFMSYEGYEGFWAMALAHETSGDFLYLAAVAQANSANQTPILAKYTLTGTQVWTRTLGNTASTWDSRLYALCVDDGAVYVAGYVQHQPAPLFATVWSYDFDGTENWSVQDAPGAFYGIAVVDGGIVAVGEEGDTNPGQKDYLAARLTSSGSLVWSETWGGSGDDLFYGVTASGGRIFAVGSTNSEGSGNEDAAILELDGATGTTIATTLLGGSESDVAYAVAVLDSTLYLGGTSASFVGLGNGPGEKDAFLAVYSLQAENACGGVEPCGLRLPGDCNQDSELDISDATCILGHLFLGRPRDLPCDEPGSTALVDVNGDQTLGIADVIYVLAFLFVSGPNPVLGSECVPIGGCTDACATP